MLRNLVAALALGLIVASALTLVAWTGREERRPPNVVLISIDTLRADHLGSYGYPLRTSPYLDRFRRDAALFREAIAHSPSTLPSHASIFTSLYPQHHGASHTQLRALSPEAITLAEALKTGGYRTFAVVGGGQISTEFGLAQGFDVYQEEAHDETFLEVVQHGLSLLDQAQDKPWFLFLHTYEVHHPYTPSPRRLATFDAGYTGSLPGEISVEQLTAINAGQQIDDADLAHIIHAYDAEIASVDLAFGFLVNALESRGDYRDTMIVFTSDHGEEFGEHGQVGWHSHTLYDELLHVPLLIKLPQLRHAGREVTGAVRSVDIAPTILAVAGLELPRQFVGRSLLPVIRRGEGRPLPALLWRETMPFETGSFSGIRTDGWKLHEEKLFDLGRDPAEKRELGTARPDIRRKLEKQLSTLLASRRPIQTLKIQLDEASRDELKALGYIQ